MSDPQNGKGSNRRPTTLTMAEQDERWEMAFGDSRSKKESAEACPAMDARQERLDCIESKFECSGNGRVTYTGEKPASFEVEAAADIITQSEHDSFVPGEGQDCE